METPKSGFRAGMPLRLETFLSGMETSISKAKTKGPIPLETFLSGMETNKKGEIRMMKNTPLKPSLVEWKLHYHQHIALFSLALETFLSGMETHSCSFISPFFVFLETFLSGMETKRL